MSLSGTDMEHSHELLAYEALEILKSMFVSDWRVISDGMARSIRIDKIGLHFNGRHESECQIRDFQYKK